MQLHRQLGISYNAAWRIKHKLTQVMLERDQEHKLSGFIELDDAYLGGKRTGCKPGRGAADKTPFVAAVVTNANGHPTRIKLSVVKGFRKTEIAAWCRLNMVAGSTVTSDGLACFNAVTDKKCLHEKIVCGGGRASVEEPKLYWGNTILRNLKSTLRGIYHAIRPPHTPPMPEKLLKLSLA